MNEFCRCTSSRIQPAKFKHVFENGAMSKSPPRNKKENTMLRKFAAALVATTLIAGPAFAQSTELPARRRRSGGADRSGRANSVHAGDQAGRQDGEERPSTRPSMSASMSRASTKSRAIASGASCQAGKTHQAGVAKSDEAVRNRARLPAIRNMHPTKVRTEARIVRTGLRARRKPSRPQAGL